MQTSSRFLTYHDDDAAAATVAVSLPCLAIPINKAGVPFITADKLQRIITPREADKDEEIEGPFNMEEEVVFTVSVFDLLGPSVEACKATNKSFAELCNLTTSRNASKAKTTRQRKCTVILQPRSSFSGFHTVAPSNDKGISGYTEAGKTSLTPQQYLDVTNVIRPDFVVPLFDCLSASAVGASTRRGKVALARTHMWTTEFHAKTVITENTNKTTTKERDKRATTTATGLVVPVGNALLANNTTTRTIDPPTSSEKQAHQDCSSSQVVFHAAAAVAESRAERHLALRTPTTTQKRSRGENDSTAAVERPVVISPCGESIVDILEAISAGVDIVETTLPFMLAKRGVALRLCLNPDKQHTASSTSSSSSSVLQKRQPLINLWDPSHQLEHIPIDESFSCPCYTCQRNHTRSYIHHLLMVQEMNAEILLSIHNVTTLVRLFREIRNRLNNDSKKKSGGEGGEGSFAAYRHFIAAQFMIL